MKRITSVVAIIGLAVFLSSGCARHIARHPSLAVNGGSLLNTRSDEDLGDAVTALESVAGGISARPVRREQLVETVKTLQTDPEAMSAIRTISGSFDPTAVTIKYSPVTGKRYSADLEFDPETGARLLPLE